mmetsp:Transcript_22130/g.34268  ORF Transcript_22130/g.34268 Transcript_22130/m.34268 type:complete len:125 (+) Transcript_22130:1280-1654(+)
MLSQELLEAPPLLKQATTFKDDLSMTESQKKLEVNFRLRDQDEIRSTTTFRTKKNKMDGQKTINQYKIVKNLGKGSFATVKLVLDTKSLEYYAMKSMNKKDLKKKLIGKSTNAYMYVLEELKVL